MIEIVDLVKDIKLNDLRGTKIRAVDGVSFSVPENSIFSIVGVNGAGKSTLLKVVLKFLAPTVGSTTIRPGVRFGYLPENPYYYDYLTFKELLWFAAKASKLTDRQITERTIKVATAVGMQNSLKHKLRSFSKGMVQRAGIAAAIVHDPELLILDEPMSGLDPLGRKLVFDLIQQMKAAGKTVLFCSHILNDVERLCDHVVIMKSGRVEHFLSKDENSIFSHQDCFSLLGKPDDLEKIFYRVNAQGGV